MEKSLYGKTHFGTERSTFAIGAKDEMIAVLPKIKPSEHVDQLLAVLE